MRNGHIRDVWCFGTGADLPGCNADDEGENHSGLTATDTKTRSLNQAPVVRLSSGRIHLTRQSLSAISAHWTERAD